MSTVPGALLICLTSPYARRGETWKAYRRHFGQTASPVLVAVADTKTMNPTVPDAVIAQAYADDPARAAAEYGAVFRSDLESYIGEGAVDVVTVPGRLELPPVAGVTYRAGYDAAADPGMVGGNGGDALGLGDGGAGGDGGLGADGGNGGDGGWVMGNGGVGGNGGDGGFGMHWHASGATVGAWPRNGPAPSSTAADRTRSLSSIAS